MAPHTALIGSSGSGKTLFQKGWMAAALPGPTESGGLRFRALIYDPKRELYPFLCAIGIPEDQIIVTHPFDARAAAWDLARDFQEPAQIEELTELLVPKKEYTQSESSEFFDRATRIILQDLIAGLIDTSSDNWDLRDITECCQNLSFIEQLLDRTPNGRDTWRAFFKTDDARLSDNIRASIVAAVRPFQTLASIWHRSPRRFSLERWSSGSGILLLGADPRRETTMQRLNQLMFRRVSQLVLGRAEENPADLTFFFLDEVREAGKLGGLRQLLTESRSKGGRVVLGFQGP